MNNLTVAQLMYKIRHIVILAALMLTLTVLKPGAFLSVANISNVLWAVSVFGAMTCGTIYVILTGGIDLSVGAVAGLSGIIVYKTLVAMDYSTASVVLGISFALLAGVAIGLFHGVIVTSFSIPPFLITIATTSIISGISIAITNGETFGILKPEAFVAIGKAQMPILIMFALAAVSFFVLNKTVFGRQVYAVGGNPVAANLSGISSKKVTLFSYAASGLTAAIGGVVLSSMTQQASPMMGKNYEMDVLTAIVVGGASLAGGEGNIQGAVFGVVLVGLINNGLNLMNAPSTYHLVVKGVVIVAAVALDYTMRNHESGKKAVPAETNTTVKG